MTSLAPSIPKLISNKKSIHKKPKSLLFVGKDINVYGSHFSGFSYNYLTSKNCLTAFYKLERMANSYPNELPEVLICDHELLKEGDYSLIAHIRCNSLLANIPFIIIGANMKAADKNNLVELGILEFYDVLDEPVQLNQRLSSLKNNDFNAPIRDYSKDNRLKYKTNIVKRFFDIVFASLLLIAFAPLMLMIAIVIKLESKGPLFYISKRAGAAYKIFDFYKFRTMVPDAEEKLVQLQEKNQYTSTTLDPEFYFVKIKDDPRITRFGRFLRNTSLDELPQLFNVLKGDMSIIGNRPLPLYEAEQLKRDKLAKRFMAPAGITGLWQITKRGGKKMSAVQRVALDILYAEQESVWTDVKILFLTIPAMFQRESV